MNSDKVRNCSGAAIPAATGFPLLLAKTGRRKTETVSCVLLFNKPGQKYHDASKAAAFHSSMASVDLLERRTSPPQA
jgi:hypothetical protein